MSRLCTTLFATLCLSIGAAEAENFYVRSEDCNCGKRDGSNWNHAFAGMPSPRDDFWRSKLKPGDVIYVAGGVYRREWRIEKSGASGRPLTIKRATAIEHGTDEGWGEALDRQVVLQHAGITIYAFDHIIIEGAVRNGIKIVPADLDGNRAIYLSPGNANGSNHVVLRHIEVAGPGVSKNEIRAIANTPTRGGATGCLIEYCTLHDVASAIFLADLSHVTIQHCTFYNLNADGPHENVVWAERSAHVTFRWNTVYNSVAEGVFLRSGNKFWNIYGNIFRDCGYGVATKARLRNTDIRVCNNSFTNVKYPIFFKDASNTGLIRNNLIHDSDGRLHLSYGGAVHDYNWYSGDHVYSETNGIAGGKQNPFVNASQHDYRLKPGTSAIAQGATTEKSHDQTVDGALHRPSKGWSVGAYEYPGSGDDERQPLPAKNKGER